MFIILELIRTAWSSLTFSCTFFRDLWWRTFTSGTLSTLPSPRWFQARSLLYSRSFSGNLNLHQITPREQSTSPFKFCSTKIYQKCRRNICLGWRFAYRHSLWSDSHFPLTLLRLPSISISLPVENTNSFKICIIFKSYLIWQNKE